jgi:hypothetical protein
MANEIKVYDQDGEIVAVFNSVERKGDKLVVDGKALGYMRMDMIFTFEEILHGLKMALCWGVISFILLLPYYSIRHLFRRFVRS